MNPKQRLPAVLATVSIAATVGAVLVLTRPEPHRAAPHRVTEVVREPGEAAPARDEENHYAPGSPAAVAERFLRVRLRYHYDDAAELATGAERARCERNVRQFTQLSPDQREGVRQAQLIAEAAQFDFEQVVTEPTAAGDGGAARKLVRGVLHARGPVEGRTVESRREQSLILEMVDGAWRVCEWTPGRNDGGIVVH